MTEKNDIVRNIIYLADRGGTGFWRHISQVDTFNAYQRQNLIFNTYTENIIFDPKYYIGVRSVTLQRWVANEHKEVFEKFLLPVAKQTNTAIIYALDDSPFIEDIPLFNSGYELFSDPNVQENIKYMMSNSDYIVTSTSFLKNRFAEKLNYPTDKIIAVPNMLPHWWFGDRFIPEKKEIEFRNFKNRPRIGIVSSGSHYNYKGIKDQNGNFVKDDLDEIADVIRDTVNDFQWVIIGMPPRQIEDLVSKGKIEVYSYTPIHNYPSLLSKLSLQGAVAMLQKTDFNRCKSPIKYLECSAVGVPLFATKMLPYEGIVPDGQLFDTPDELREKLNNLKWMSVGAYMKMVQKNWSNLNSPRHEGDFNLNDSWLEHNMGIWDGIFRLSRQKTEEVVQ